MYNFGLQEEISLFLFNIEEVLHINFYKLLYYKISLWKQFLSMQLLLVVGLSV